jgi:D-alanyl-D-alanine dipeptidase
MGTGFDNFSTAAHHSYLELQPQVLLNRKILKEIMEHFGFKSLETEWWHYSLPNPKRYEVLNLSFRELAD